MSELTTALPLPESLSRSNFSAELRALWAVVRREWIIFRRYPSWIIGLFIWPVIFPAAYILFARALAGPQGEALVLFQQASGMDDYLGFIAVGTTIWMWQNVVLWNLGLALRQEQLRGTLETNWLSPTWRFSFLLGSSLTQLVTMFIFLLVSAVEFGLVFGVTFRGSFWLALLVLLASIPSVYGLGTVFASLVITVKEANAFVQLVRGIVMVFCGITFPISLLPGWMEQVARWLPQTYVIRAMRLAVLTDASISQLVPDLVALMLFGLLWLATGYLMFSWMERRARRTGSIGQY